MEDNSKEYIDFLPVGSVVIVKGNVKKMAIIARGVMTEIKSELRFFDYAAVLYPEGLVSDKLIYFNHKDINKVIYMGFVDDDEIIMKENLNNWIHQTSVRRGSAYELNMENLAKGKA